MKILIGANIEEKLAKLINDIRYKYDQELLKEIPPVIELVGPINSRVNTNRLHKHIEYTISHHKSIKMEFKDIVLLSNEQEIIEEEDVDGYDTEDLTLSIAFKINSKLSNLRYDLYQTALFGSIPKDIDYENYIFTIKLIENNSFSNWFDIKDDIKKEYYLKKHFFIPELSMLIKDKEGRWEISYNYPF